MDVATREKCLYVAKLAEQAERYDGEYVPGRIFWLGGGEVLGVL